MADQLFILAALPLFSKQKQQLRWEWNKSLQPFTRVPADSSVLQVRLAHNYEDEDDDDDDDDEEAEVVDEADEADAGGGSSESTSIRDGAR